MGVVRKPKLTEIAGIKALLDQAAADGHILPRELAELYTNVRDFYVYIDPRGDVGGCAALHIDMVDLAEVRSLVVRADLRGRRVGERLVRAVVDEARALDIARVYALTRVPVFFERMNFHVVQKQELPYKVFKDCMRCPLFSECDEEAFVMDLGPRKEDEQRALDALGIRRDLGD